MLKPWDTEQIINEVSQAIQQAGVALPEDVKRSLMQAASDAEKRNTSGPERQVLEAVIENIETAEHSMLPLCQDTGMVVMFADIGTDVVLEQPIEALLSEAVGQAYHDGWFRKSVVSDPVFSRENTGTNLPAVIYCRCSDSTGLKISGLLKGFGSENCSSLVMLNPTAGAAGVVQSVVDSVRTAGGKPCPPVIIGVGIGSTADGAPVLAKRALLRSVGSHHPDTRYAELERDIYEKVNALQIGPGGMGGFPTALAVMIEHAPTHIAGLPVAVNISCWADRKFSVEITE